MRVSSILAAKGAEVRIVSPSASACDAARDLHHKKIGALVVTENGVDIDGLFTERALVEHLAEHGSDIVSHSVADVMIQPVHTCRLEDSSEELMRMMTNLRVRHFPVIDENGLCGIVSIGDLVKSRVTELEDEARHMHDYIVTGR